MVNIWQSKKGGMGKVLRAQASSKARENRVLLTSYLVEEGYRDQYQLARFWGLSSNTVKIYMREAQYVTLSDQDKEKIKQIQKRMNCSFPDAVMEFYNSSFSSCFIATAAYGTPFAEEINVLRYWRDNFLLINFFGKVFVKTYYATSPPIADYISDKKNLKSLVRLVLNPYVKFLKWIYKD